MIYKVGFKPIAVSHHNMTRYVYVKEEDIDYIQSVVDDDDYEYLEMWLKRDIKIVYNNRQFKSTDNLKSIDSIESI